MPIEVEVPDVGTVEFPDTMSEGDITSALNKQYGQPSPEKEELRRQMREARAEGIGGKAIEGLTDIGQRAAYTLSQMAGAPEHLLRQVLPTRPLVSPEAAEKAVQFMTPFANAPEGSWQKGLEQFTGSLLSGMTDPVALAAFISGRGAPQAIGKGFQAQMLGAVPENIQQIQQAPDTAQAVAATAATAANILLPAAIERGITPRTEAETILPQSAKALEETPTAKGEPTDATQERIVEENRQREHIGTEAQRLPAEAGGRNRPESSAEAQPAQVPYAEEGQGRLLLIEKLRQEGLTQESAKASLPEPGRALITTAKPPPSLPEKAAEAPPLEAASASMAQAKPAEAPAGEPQPAISEAKPETAQAQPTATFLDRPKDQWTSDYYKSLPPEGRRAVRTQAINALTSLGGKTKLTQESKPDTVLKAIGEIIDLKGKGKEPTQISPPAPEPLYAGIPMPKVLERIDRNLEVTRKALATKIRSAPNRRVMDQTMDATDNMAAIAGRKSGNSLRIDSTPIEREAAYAMVEANGDPAAPATFIAKATGKDEHAVEVAQYLQAHWNDPRLQQLAGRARQLLDRQIHQEEAAGINTEYREAYVPHLLDQEKFMGVGKPYVIGGNRGGIATGFKKGRTHNTIYDDIEAGLPVKTMDIADAVEHRIKVGQKLINRVEWADSLRGIVDPTDGNPIVTSLVKHRRTGDKAAWESASIGYSVREIVPGMRLAVHEGYTSLWDALTGSSKVAATMPGKMILEAEGALKHSLLLFDTFHVSRILQKQIALTPKGAGWTKGFSLLEYSVADLNRAVASGEITPEIANYVRANRADANLLLKSGLNVGRIQENLYNSVVRDIPILGKINKWIFEKMTRGAMMQSALIELERVQRQFGLSREEAAMKVSRDLNAYFGNIGRQGIFKSQSARDVASIVGLAPQWVESMLRTEIGSVGKAVIDPIRYRKLAVSSIPLGVGTALAAYFVGTQLLNMVTRGHPTWENPEKGHKLDAWIPDVTGKSGGFFLSPFSVAAEVTHDMIRYIRTEPDAMSAAFRILGNKASPLSRALWVLGTGQTWDQGKVVGAWNKAKAAAIGLVPTPIGIAPIITGQKYPGQAQRQITASLGIKTEPAPTPRQEVYELVRDWGLNNKDPNIRRDFERRQKEQFAKSAYDPLRKALTLEPSKAVSEVRKLRDEGISADRILRAFEPKPFAGSLVKEQLFLKTLNPQQRVIYDQAKNDQRALYKKAASAIRQNSATQR